MNITLDQIENLLYATSGNRAWLDLLAPQEIDRLVFLVQEALVKADTIATSGSAANYNAWATKFIQEIGKELKELEELFGIKNLVICLNWQEFLKELYSRQKQSQAN